MTEHNWNLTDLQALSASSVQLSYNVDAPDTLSFVLQPERYDELPLERNDRLTLTDGGRVIFSGLVPLDANYSNQAAQGEQISVELASDYYILEHTVFAKRGYKGDTLYVRTPVGAKTTSLSDVANAVSSWIDGYLPSTLTCAIDARIPTPTSNGTSPCSALLEDGIRWVPDAVIIQRYAELGNSIVITRPEDIAQPLELNPELHPLQSVSLQARHDLQVPACALVGGVHKVWPPGADVRALGAFVYAVPIQRAETDEEEPSLAGAGGSPASSKMIIRGVRLPENVLYEVSPEEFKMKDVAGLPNTVAFIKTFFPEYAPFAPYLLAGSCIVKVTKAEDLFDNEDSEEDEAKVPANYSESPTSWSADGKGVFVHTEGSFSASANSRKNLRGVKWCKASMSIVLAVKLNGTEVPKTLWPLGMQLFPGRRNAAGNRYGYVRKTLACNLINKRKKIYDPATNKLCSTDPDFEEEKALQQPEDESPSYADYISAMGQYYAAANQLQHEGSITMLHDGQFNPAALTGLKVKINGMRPEWATMNATIRSVQWNVAECKIALSLGSRAAQGFDEYLERRLLARNRGRDEAQRIALAADALDEEEQAADEDAMPVSPSISAGTDKESDGRWHKPFSLYIKEDDLTGVVVLKGGELRRGKETFTVEDSETQIKDGVPGSAPWIYGSKVRLRWKRKAGKTTFDIYQR